MKTRIIIEVSGGVVQEITVNGGPSEVHLIDWDNIKQGDTGKELYPATSATDEQFNTILAGLHKQIDEYIRR